MKSLLAVAMLSVCTSRAFSGGEVEHPRLTTNVLEQVSQALEKAGNTQNLEGLLAHLASNVVITVSFPQNPEYPRMTFSKDTYADHLKETWTKTRDVSIRRLTTEFEIAADGQTATATATFRQTATVKDTGQTFTSTGKQISRIALVDGIPNATRIDVTISYK